MLPQANKWKAEREREQREIDATSYEKQVMVIASCTGNYLPEDSVEFVNIEEDMMGRDLLTFICPLCKEKHQSFRLG